MKRVGGRERERKRESGGEREGGRKRERMYQARLTLEFTPAIKPTFFFVSSRFLLFLLI